MSPDELITLPLAIWAKLREEGLAFSLALDVREPDIWRFRFAPNAHLDVNTNGEWAWRGPVGRARRLVIPIVEEAQTWLAGARCSVQPVTLRPAVPTFGRSGADTDDRSSRRIARDAPRPNQAS